MVPIFPNLTIRSAAKSSGIYSIGKQDILDRGRECTLTPLQAHQQAPGYVHLRASRPGWSAEMVSWTEA